MTAHKDFPSPADEGGEPDLTVATIFQDVSMAGPAPRKDEPVSTQAVARTDERAQRPNVVKDNWLGFVGDVLKFSGEVCFKSMLRIDGNFEGRVTSSDGTLIVSTGAQITEAVINVATAKINGTVHGDVNVTKELVLGPTAVVTGRLSTPALTVQEGALFNGTCQRPPS